MTYRTGDNNYGVAKWIVDPVLGQGTHQTIAAAITAASSGDTIFLRPGTYTENITLKAGVNLAAFTADQLTPNVVILGTTTATFVGIVSCTGIQFKTNSAACITSSGANAAVLKLYACEINANNNTGITSTNASFNLDIFNSYLVASATFAIWGITTIAGLGINNSVMVSGDSTSNSIAANAVNIYNSNVGIALATSSAASLNVFNSILNNGTPLTFITTAGTGGANILNCVIESGSSSAISVGSGTSVTVSNTTISSSNTNAITGAGTLNFSNITFIGSSSTINTTTQVVNKSAAISMDSSSTKTGIAFDGTNFLKNYVEAGSWTPTITFGGGSTGITYAVRAGEYTRVGNVVFFTFNISLTSKGSSTGIAAITALPITVGGTNGFMPVAHVAAVTVAVGQAYVSMSPSGTGLALFTESLTGAGATNLTDVQFANTSSLFGNGFYFTS